MAASWTPKPMKVAVLFLSRGRKAAGALRAVGQTATSGPDLQVRLLGAIFNRAVARLFQQPVLLSAARGVGRDRPAGEREPAGGYQIVRAAGAG